MRQEQIVFEEIIRINDAEREPSIWKATIKEPCIRFNLSIVKFPPLKHQYYVKQIKNELFQKNNTRHWRRFGVFIVNFEHISHLFLVFLLLTLNRLMPAVYTHYF